MARLIYFRICWISNTEPNTCFASSQWVFPGVNSSPTRQSAIRRPLKPFYELFFSPDIRQSRKRSPDWEMPWVWALCWEKRLRRRGCFCRCRDDRAGIGWSLCWDNCRRRNSFVNRRTSSHRNQQDYCYSDFQYTLNTDFSLIFPFVHPIFADCNDYIIHYFSPPVTQFQTITLSLHTLGIIIDYRTFVLQ